jgi:lysophospholipase L1-like esterase
MSHQLDSHARDTRPGPPLWLFLLVGCTALSCPVAHWGTGNDAPLGAEDVGSQNALGVIADSVEEDTADTGEDRDGDATGADVTIEDLWDELRLGRRVSLETAPMARFFAALDGIANKKSGRLVRILHYGDSHTAADVLPSTIRRTLQKRFGYGGRGFVLLGKPWRTYRPLDVETGVKGNWEAHRILLGRDPASMDGRYGLGGVVVDSVQPGAQVSVSTSGTTYFGNKASRFEILYLNQPRGGCFTAYVDGRMYKKVCTASEQLRTGVLDIDLKERSHRVDLTVNGGGQVRFFGAVVERPGPGVVYDVLGINGAFFYTPLRWDATLLAEQVTLRNPDLIITMYGANEAASGSLTEENYRDRVRQALERIRAGAEEASCLMLGPMDRVLQKTASGEDRLDLITRVQHEVADEAGCSFMDLRELMGGPGAYRRWQAKGLAQGDGVHLNISGYHMLGEAIVQQILDRYDQYHEAIRSSSKKPPTHRSGELPDGRND